VLLAFGKTRLSMRGSSLGNASSEGPTLIERAKTDGAMAALDAPSRPGKEPTSPSRPNVGVALACRKAKEAGLSA